MSHFAIKVQPYNDLGYPTEPRFILAPDGRPLTAGHAHDLRALLAVTANRDATRTTYTVVEWTPAPAPIGAPR